MLGKLMRGSCIRRVSLDYPGLFWSKNGKKNMHHITLNINLNGTSSNQTLYIPQTLPLPTSHVSDNRNVSRNERKLYSLSLTEVCSLLHNNGLQDIVPFIHAQNLTGLYLHDGVDHPQDLVDAGLNIIQAKTLFKRLMEWKENGVPLDISVPADTAHFSVSSSERPETAVSASSEDINSVSSEHSYLNESVKHNLWMEQDYHAARWCSDQSAVKRLMQAANDHNDPIAQMHLSVLYKYGCKHVKQDEVLATKYATRALPWLKRHAIAGNAAAQYYYGYALGHGMGVPGNKAEGVRYYQLAADQGLSIALTALGTCYLKGDGVPKYEEVGVSYLRSAVTAGSIAAEVNLALCYKNGFGVDVNELEMVKIFRKIAELGYANVQYYFGMHYLEGSAEKQNLPKALHWLKLSAEQDYVDAIVALGYLYETGKGVDKDAAIALKYFQQGVALGSAYAADAVERVVDLVEQVVTTTGQPAL